VTLPGPPTIRFVTAGDKATTISWNRPVSDGGSPITGYAVTPYIGSSPQQPVTFNSTATTQTVSGLTNGITYRFAVQAFNARGTGAYSALSTPVTPGTPGAPVIGAVLGGDAQATVSWTAPANEGAAPITGYVVTSFMGYAPQPPIAFDTSATTQTITGLANGTTYRFAVQAVNAMGTGAYSDVSNSVTPGSPEAPTIGTAVAGDAQATLSWTAPANEGAAPITGYAVTPYIGFTPQPAVTFDSTATTETVTGLTNGSNYRFRVQAVSAMGIGTYSKASNQVTPVTRPGAPIIGQAAVAYPNVTLSWVAPASNGGTFVTGYVVTPYVDGIGLSPITFASTATAETITGLAEGVTYTFTVAAINAVGAGPDSAASNPVTVAPTVPGPPNIGSATAGSGRATVSWTAPLSDGGAPVTGYIVTPYVGSWTGVPRTFNSTATTQVVTGLTNGWPYRFRVQAVNAVGAGGYSAETNRVTPTAS
jgi:titin